MSDKPKAVTICPELLGAASLNLVWGSCIGGGARGAMFAGNLKKEPVVKEKTKHE